MKIAIIDKAPSRNDYSKYFDFEFDLWHMSSQPLPGKMLKKDVDLEVDLEEYDLVILVGAEAAKNYANIKSTTTMAGTLVDDKYVALPNPAMLIFKPEGKPEFQAACERIKKYAEGFKPSTELGDFKGINNAEEALAFLQEVLKCNTGYTAWDTETTALAPRDGYVLGLSMTYKPRHGRYIITDILDERHLTILQEISDKTTVIFHNMKFDYKMITYHLGIEFNRKNVHDTMCMMYVLDENSSLSLKMLAQKYTHYGDYDSALDDFKKKYCHDNKIKEEDFTYDLIPYDIISTYAAIDTAATYELFFIFWEALKKNNKLMGVYEDLIIRSTLFLMDMEEVGIPMSRERLLAAEVFLDEQIAEATERLYEFEEVKAFEHANGAVFNPASPIQLRKLLFDFAGISPTGKLTATGAISTDAEVLEELSEEHELPKAILKIRKLSKIKNTYVTKLLPALDRDGRVRTNFNNVFTTSGRLSSSGKFNAQQIPRDDPIIKGCIVAPEGYTIVSQDLATAEMYIAAVLSKDKNLQQVFKDKKDFHSSIAKMVFDLPGEVDDSFKEAYKTERQSAKAISFGILYGSGPSKVADTVTKASGQEYPLWKATDDIKSYFTKFSRLKDWINETKRFIEANGFVYSFFGRKRRLPNVNSTDKGIASGEIRSGINATVQSLASDVNLLAAMDLHDELKRRKMKSRIFMLVHDSIVGLVADEELQEYCSLLRELTQKDRGCSIPNCPIGVDQEIGKDYSFGKWDKKYLLEGNKLSRLPDTKKAK